MRRDKHRRVRNENETHDHSGRRRARCVLSQRSQAGCGRPRPPAPSITIWTDQNRQTAVTKVANAWAAARGATVKVVVKDFGDIETNLGTVAADGRTGRHRRRRTTGPASWRPTASSSRSILEPAVKTQFPAYTLNAFSYGLAVKKLYGVPTQIENIGLVVNTGLVKVPTTFAQLEARRSRSRRRSTGNLGIAVQQGAAGDAYHMYPFFSGLGGYVFGTNSAGNLDPSNIGVANKKFLKNAPLIDKWNKEGLINSKVDSSTAQNAFIKKQAAFWITGPWNSTAAQEERPQVQGRPDARRSCIRSVPFLGVQGFMVTKYATVHGVDAAGEGPRVQLHLRPRPPSTQLALANGRSPANTSPARRSTTRSSRSSARPASAASRCRTSPR